MKTMAVVVYGEGRSRQDVLESFGSYIFNTLSRPFYRFVADPSAAWRQITVTITSRQNERDTAVPQ